MRAWNKSTASRANVRGSIAVGRAGRIAMFAFSIPPIAVVDFRAAPGIMIHVMPVPLIAEKIIKKKQGSENGAAWLPRQLPAEIFTSIATLQAMFSILKKVFRKLLSFWPNLFFSPKMFGWSRPSTLTNQARTG